MFYAWICVCVCLYICLYVCVFFVRVCICFSGPTWVFLFFFFFSYIDKCLIFFFSFLLFTFINIIYSCVCFYIVTLVYISRITYGKQNYVKKNRNLKFINLWRVYSNLERALLLVILSLLISACYERSLILLVHIYIWLIARS